MLIWAPKQNLYILLNITKKGLAAIGKGANEKERNIIKKKTEKLMNKFFYFKTVWKLRLNHEQRQDILNITSSGNREFPHGKIGDFNSFGITPVNSIFFRKSEFYSKFKQEKF